MRSIAQQVKGTIYFGIACTVNIVQCLMAKLLINWVSTCQKYVLNMVDFQRIFNAYRYIRGKVCIGKNEDFQK